jgi:hypothetical protein
MMSPPIAARFVFRRCMRLRLPFIQSPWKKPVSPLPKAKKGKRKMKIAVEGCCHGELDAIYASLQRIQHEKGIKVDLLLIGGDFQVLKHPLLLPFWI